MVLIWSGLIFYGLPTAAVSQWAVFYMKDLGVSTTQIGFLSVITTTSSLGFLLLGGVMTDALGRKKTNILLDVIAWVGGYIILAVAQNFAYFVIYSVVWGVSAASGVAYGCLFAESVRPESRGEAYALNAVLSPLPGLFMPFLGVLVIEHFQTLMGPIAGLVYAVRLLYFAVAASVVGGVTLRYFKVREITPAVPTAGFLPRRYLFVFSPFPPRLPRLVFHTKLLESYWEDLRWLWNRRAPFYYWLTTALASVASAIPSIVYPLYVVEELGLQLSALALLASTSTATGIIITLFIAPRLGVQNLKKFLLIGYSVLPASPLLFIMAGRNLLLLATSSVVGSISGAFAGPAGGGYWADIIPDARRAKVSAVTGIMNNALVIPAGFIGVILYQEASFLPWIVVAATEVVALLILLNLPDNPLDQGKKS